MHNDTSFQKVSHDLFISRPRDAQAIAIPKADWDFLKTRIPKTKPEVNGYLSAGFFMSGCTVTALTQAGHLFRARATGTAANTNEIILWCATVFCAFAAVACFVFAKCRFNDAKRVQTDVTDYIKHLEDKYWQE